MINFGLGFIHVLLIEILRLLFKNYWRQIQWIDQLRVMFYKWRYLKIKPLNKNYQIFFKEANLIHNHNFHF
jgi:hypothetical protein